MYELFNRNFNGTGKFTPINKVSTLKPCLLRDMNKIIAHYKKQQTEVPRSHLIVQLIENLNLRHTKTDDGIINGCLDRASHVCKQLGVVHTSNPNPSPMSGIFYSNHVNEIIIIDEAQIVDVDSVRKQWMNYNPIRIMTHPFNDINMALCDGKYPSSQSGYAVFIINLPLLILQYKYWCLQRVKANIDVFRPGLFVSQLVIPNMLFNHMYISFVNRMIDNYDGKTTPPYKRQHPLSLVDYTTDVDTFIGEQVSILNGPNPVDVHSFYNCFPALLGGKILDLIQVPDIPPTMYTRWALEASSIKYLDFMVRYYKGKGSETMRQFADKILRDIRIMENSREIKTNNTQVLKYFTDIKNALS